LISDGVDTLTMPGIDANSVLDAPRRRSGRRLLFPVLAAATVAAVSVAGIALGAQTGRHATTAFAAASSPQPSGASDASPSRSLAASQAPVNNCGWMSFVGTDVRQRATAGHAVTVSTKLPTWTAPAAVTMYRVAVFRQPNHSAKPPFAGPVSVRMNGPVKPPLAGSVAALDELQTVPVTNQVAQLVLTGSQLVSGKAITLTFRPDGPGRYQILLLMVTRDSGAGCVATPVGSYMSGGWIDVS